MNKIVLSTIAFIIMLSGCASKSMVKQQSWNEMFGSSKFEPIEQNLSFDKNINNKSTEKDK